MKNKNIKEFRNFKIIRSCTESYDNHDEYRPALKKDFHSRCAYCNMPDYIISETFHVDHFIPSKEYEHKKDELYNDYNNLMYSCPKCNKSKGKKYKGNIYNDKIENGYFYNPVDVDYNDIFYINDMGSICSNDKLGRSMINTLKLYRPIHNLAWLIDEILETRKKLQEKLSQDIPDEVKDKLKDAYNEINEYYIELKIIFDANYYNKKFKNIKGL